MPESSDKHKAARGFNDDNEDAALLARITRGDRAAFHELYTRYYHPLLRFLYRLTGELEAAQDGINDVMFIVWRNGASFAGRSKVGTWIMGIAYRKALKHIKNNRRWLDRFKASELTDSIELSGIQTGHTDSLDLDDWLEHGMRALSAKQRAVVELTYYYGYSYEEIGSIMDCPVNTVKTRMFHARAKLKRALKGPGKDIDAT